MSDLHIPTTDYKTEFPASTAAAAQKSTGAAVANLLMVPIDRLVAPADFNVRVHTPAYEAHVEDIAKSIAKDGFFQHFPLAGYSGKEGEETFIYITDGFTRFAAAKRAVERGVAIERLPVVLRAPGTSTIDLTVGLVKNNTGVQLTPYERSIVAKRLVNLGLTEDDIANRLDYSKQYVVDLLHMQTLPMPLHQLVISGKCSLNTAVRTHRQHGAQTMAVLTEAINASAGTPNGDAAEGASAGSPAAGRATPTNTRTKGKVIGKNTYIAAIKYTIGIPVEPAVAIDFLKRWLNGDKDAVAELKTMEKEVLKKNRKPKGKTEAAKAKEAAKAAMKVVKDAERAAAKAAKDAEKAAAKAAAAKAKAAAATAPPPAAIDPTTGAPLPEL